MPYAKPVYFSENGQLSNVENVSGSDTVAFRQDSSTGKWDTLIVPNLLNDDQNGLFKIKGNDSTNGEFTFMTFDCSKNSGTSNEVKLELNRHVNDIIDLTNNISTIDGTDSIGAIKIKATQGGIGLHWNDSKDLWAEGGRAIITVNENTSEAIKLHADNGSSQTIKIINDEGTTNGTDGEGAIDIEATNGGIGLRWNDSKSLWAEGGQVMIVANQDTTDAIKLHADTGSNQTIHILNDEGTSESAIQLTSGAGGVDIDAAAGKDINLSGGQITITSKTDEANAFSVTTNQGSSETIVLTNTRGTDESAIQLNSIAGGVDIDAAAGKDINLSGGQITITSKTNEANAFYVNTNQGSLETIVLTNTQGTSESAIQLISSAGGVDIDAAAGKDVNISGGQINITSKTNEANAFSVTTNQGSLETIVLQNTQGTDESAIQLNSLAGGVNIDAAVDKDVNISGGQITITSKTNEANAFSVTTNQGISETIVLTNTQGTSESAIQLISGAGGVDIDTGKNITLDSSNGNISLDSTNGSISLDSKTNSNFSTSTGSLTFSGAAGVSITSTTSTNGVSVTSTGGTLTLDGTGQTVDLNATTLDLDATTIDIDSTTVNLNSTTINSNFIDNNIIGNTNITGNLNMNTGTNRYTFPTNRPNNSYILSASDANGTLEWVEPSASITSTFSDPNTSLEIGKNLKVGGNLETTGIGTIKNLTFNSGSIVSSSGAIDFSNNNLTTTGTVKAGIGTFTTVTIGNITIDVNEIKVLNGAPLDGASKADTVVVTDSNRDVTNINDLSITNDLHLNSDSSELSLGSGKDYKITHDGSTGATTSTTGKHDITVGASSTWKTTSGTLTIEGESTTSIGDDTAKLVFDGSGAVSETGMTSLTLTPSNTVTIQGTGVSKYGDITGTLEFDGSGAVSETGMTSLTLTPSNTVTIQGAGVSKYGDDTATINFDGSGAVTETGMTSLTLTPDTVEIIGTNSAKYGDDTATLDFDGSGNLSNSSNLVSFKISTDSTSDDSIKLDSALGGIDIDATTKINITAANNSIDAIVLNASAGGIDIDSSGVLALDSATSISIGVNSDKPIDIDASTLEINSSEDTNITLTANKSGIGTLKIEANNGGGGTGHIDMNTDGIVTIDSTSGISLDAGADSNFTTSGGVLTFDGAGGINIGTNSDVAIDINSSTLNIDASGILDINTSGDNSHIEITSSHTSGQSILISANQHSGSILDIDAGVIDIDVQSGYTLDASGISLNSDAASNFTTSGGLLTLSSDTGININGSSSEIDITTSSSVDINSGAFTIDSTSFSIDSSSGPSNITSTTTTSGQDFEIKLVGETNSKLSIISESTGDGVGSSGIDVNALRGGLSLLSKKIMYLSTSLANNADISIKPGGTGSLLLGNSTNTKVEIGANTIIDGTLNSKDINVNGSTIISQNLNVLGNLNVTGNINSINADQIHVEDKLIILGSVASPTDITAANGGLLLKGATDKEFKWNSTDGWKSNQKITTSQGFVGPLTGNADTATKISSITNSNIVQLTDAQTLTNKTLATPVISSILNTGTITLPTSTDTLVGKATTDTLTNKTLTSPTITGTGAIAGIFTGDLTGNADTATKISSITNSNIVQLTNTQTLTNKTLTSPTITGTGAITGNFTGDLTGNADTATKISSITNSNIVQLTVAQTLTNKTLTSPTITGTLAVSDATTLSSTLAVTGATTLSSTLDVTGATGIDGDFVINTN